MNAPKGLLWSSSQPKTGRKWPLFVVCLLLFGFGYYMVSKKTTATTTATIETTTTETTATGSTETATGNQTTTPISLEQAIQLAEVLEEHYDELKNAETFTERDLERISRVILQPSILLDENELAQILLMLGRLPQRTRDMLVRIICSKLPQLNICAGNTEQREVQEQEGTDTDIASLRINTRTWNSLYSRGFVTVESVLHFIKLHGSAWKDEIIVYKGVGKGTAEDIEKAFLADERWVDIYKEYSRDISLEEIFSTKVKNILEKEGIKNLRDLKLWQQKNPKWRLEFRKFDGAGPATLSRMEDELQNYENQKPE